MSRPDADSGEGAPDRIEHRIRQQEEFASALTAQGYTDVHVLRRENGRDVLTAGSNSVVASISTVATSSR